MRIIFFIALLIVFILGGWLRIEGVLTQSFAFTYDVGRDLLAVSDIVHLGKIPLIGPTTGLPGLFYGPWWYYILIPAFFLSSGNPAGITFFMAFSGIGTVCLGYILGKRLKDSKFGLLFAGFLAFSPVMVGIATQIWNPNLAPFYIMLFFFCLHRIFDFLDKKENISIYWFIFLGVLLSLIIDSEIVFGTLFCIGIFSSFIFLFKKKFLLKYYFFIAVGFFLILLPRIIFELRHDFLMTKSIFSFTSNSLLQHSGEVSSFHPFSAFSSLGKLWNESVGGRNYSLGVFLFIVLIIGILFFYKKINNKEKFFLQVVMFILFSFFLGLSLFPGDIWSHYMIGVPVLYIFVLSLVLYKTVEYFKKLEIITISLIVLLLTINLNPQQIIKNIKNPFWEGDISLYRNQLAVVDYVYKYAQGKQFNYIAYTPPIYDYPYRYIFSWYGKNHYGYIPSGKTEKLFFLIMEPDKQYPDRLKKWLEVRNGDGKIIDQKVLKGEVQLQVRIH